MGLLFSWKKWYVYIAWCLETFTYMIANGSHTSLQQISLSASCMKTGVTTVFVNNFYLSPHVIVFLARSHKMNYPKIEHKLRK